MSPLEGAVVLAMPPAVGIATKFVAHLTEQPVDTGVVGLIVTVVMGPMVIWMARSQSRYQKEQAEGIKRRDRLLAINAVTNRKQVVAQHKLVESQDTMVGLLGDIKTLLVNADQNRITAVERIDKRFNGLGCRLPPPTATS